MNQSFPTPRALQKGTRELTENDSIKFFSKIRATNGGGGMKHLEIETSATHEVI